MKATPRQVKSSATKTPLCIAFAISLALYWQALPPTAHAVIPAPDGGYTGNNAAEGASALFSLTRGIDRVAAF